MKRTLAGLFAVALFLSSVGGAGWLSVAEAAPIESSVRFEETDLGWDDHAFTFPNGGAIRNVTQIESSSEDDLFAIAQLPYGDKWDIYHFNTDGTYYGKVVDRAELEQELIVAGAAWLSGDFDFQPEKIVFSNESGVNYLYIIHKQDDTHYPMIKYNLDTSSVANPEVVMFTQSIASIQKAYDGLLYATTRETDIYYTIDPSAPALTAMTPSWGFGINSVVKLQNGKFMASHSAYPSNGYICDTGCNQLVGSENYFSLISASADGTMVVGLGWKEGFHSNVYVNENAAVELEVYGNNVEINNEGTIFIGTGYEHQPIQVIEYHSSTNTYEWVRTIGTGRETSYENNDYHFVQDEKGHVFILDPSNGRLDEFDESGLYVRSLHLNEDLYALTYYNGLLYATGEENQNVVVISTDDFSYADNFSSDVFAIQITPGGDLFVSRQNQLEQYSINPATNERTLVHTYPFTGINLTVQTDDTVSLIVTDTDMYPVTMRFINVDTYETKDGALINSYNSWLDPSGLVTINGGRYWSIVDPSSNILYTASDRNYGSSIYYKGNNQRLVLKSFYDPNLAIMRTVPVGISIDAPSLADTPVFSTKQDEMETITGTLVTPGTINLGIDFPMNGMIVDEIEIDGDEIKFIGVRETYLQLESMPGTIYQAVIGDIGKRKAILQFNNLNNDWGSGTLQMIFMEETGEIQIQLEKNQGSNGRMDDLSLWKIDYVHFGRSGSTLSLQPGEVVKLFPHRTHFNISNGDEYVPVLLTSASPPAEPVLSSPAFGTILDPDTPEVTLEWDNPNPPGSYDQSRLLVSTDPTYRNVIKTVELTVEESYTLDTSDLYAGIPYYWKVIVANTANTAYVYSENGAFSLDHWSVTLSIDSADVTANSVQAAYEIISSDLAQYTESGIAVSTSPNPTVSDSVYSTVTQAAGEQAVTLTGLLPSTTYYARAYAETDLDTRYSASVTFTTGAGTTIPPTSPPTTPPTSPPTTPPTPDPDETACTFTDLVNHWAKTAICEAASLGIVEGVDADRYAPNLDVTRTEFAVMLARAIQVPALENEASDSFNDQESIPAWARPMINAALAAGIINGYPDGTFRPQQKITRTEMTAMVAKAMKWDTSGKQELSFADLASIPAWAVPYVAAVNERGLLEGRGDHLFVPSGVATRAEAGVLLLRLWHATRASS